MLGSASFLRSPRGSSRGALLVLSAMLALGCTSAADIGASCSDSADCLGSLACIVDASGASVCMERCDAAAWLCETGEVCLGPTGGTAVCYLGGATSIGQPCTTNLECVLGGVCVDVAGAQQCYRACRMSDEAPCPSGESCTPLEGMGTNGFCQVD